MSKDNRGFHFLIGVAVVWLFWRLLITGVLHDVGFLAFQQEQSFRGPGAIVVAFVLEALIAIGAVSVLLVSGLWDAAYTMGVLIKDAFTMGTQYLAAWQMDRKPADVEPVPDNPQEPVAELANPLIAALMDTRRRVAEQQAKIDELAKQKAPEATDGK